MYIESFLYLKLGWLLVLGISIVVIAAGMRQRGKPVHVSMSVYLAYALSLFGIATTTLDEWKFRWLIRVITTMPIGLLIYGTALMASTIFFILAIVKKSKKLGAASMAISVLTFLFFGLLMLMPAT